MRIDESIKSTEIWYVLYKGSHSFTWHQTRAIPAFTSQLQSINSHWLIFILVRWGYKANLASAHSRLAKVIAIWYTKITCHVFSETRCIYCGVFRRGFWALFRLPRSINGAFTREIAQASRQSFFLHGTMQRMSYWLEFCHTIWHWRLME